MEDPFVHWYHGKRRVPPLLRPDFLGSIGWVGSLGLHPHVLKCLKKNDGLPEILKVQLSTNFLTGVIILPTGGGRGSHVLVGVPGISMEHSTKFVQVGSSGWLFSAWNEGIKLYMMKLPSLPTFGANQSFQVI